MSRSDDAVREKRRGGGKNALEKETEKRERDRVVVSIERNCVVLALPNNRFCVTEPFLCYDPT